jgi:protein phosphatase
MSDSSDTVEMESLGHPAGWDRPKLLSAQTRVDVAGLSHPGRERPNNEDHFLVARFGRFLERLITNIPEEDMPRRFEETGYAIVVADGIGGNAAGEVASKTAILTLVNLVLGTPDWILRLDDGSFFQEAKRRSTERFGQISTVLAEQALNDPALHGFGTTLTLALSLGRDLFITHIGDSRAYLLREQTLFRLTHDHTLAQALANQGTLAQEEVASHRLRHVLTRSLGHGGQGEPDVQEIVLEDGDCLLLCTDGLNEMVEETKIGQILQAGPTAEIACRSLIEEALAGGGKDNVTVVVVRYSFPQTAPA